MKLTRLAWDGIDQRQSTKCAMRSGFILHALADKRNGWFWRDQVIASQIFFDTEELRKGNFFSLASDIKTEEGHFYELEEWIGRGGNASVFRGRQRNTGEECAIKFLLRLKSAKRFLREVKLLQSIHGDHITRYYGTGRIRVRHNNGSDHKQLPFMVMELADCNLQQVMNQEKGPLSYEMYAGQFRGLAEALAVLHSRAVHRDIKPENILVSCHVSNVG